MQIKQARWVEETFAGIDGFQKREDYPPEIRVRHEEMTQIRELTSDRLKMLLEAHKHHGARSMLICQLLIDLESSFSRDPQAISNSDSGTLSDQQLSIHSLRHLAASLCEAADYDRILSLLHRTPPGRMWIWEKHLIEIVGLGVNLFLKVDETSKLLGAAGEKVFNALFSGSDVPFLPYILFAVHCNQSIENPDFVKRSFLWPWIRRGLQIDLRLLPDIKFLGWKPREDQHIECRDVFGHTLLHVTLLTNSYESLPAIIELLEARQDQQRYHLASKSPSYGRGFTPLACCVFSKADYNSFLRLVKLSIDFTCSAWYDGASDHSFCAINLALRDRSYKRANVIVSEGKRHHACCAWAISRFPKSPRMTMKLLLQATRQPVLVEDNEDESEMEDDGGERIDGEEDDGEGNECEGEEDEGDYNQRDGTGDASGCLNAERLGNVDFAPVPDYIPTFLGQM
jgi:hypothetical protein